MPRSKATWNSSWAVSRGCRHRAIKREPRSGSSSPQRSSRPYSVGSFGITTGMTSASLIIALAVALACPAPLSAKEYRSREVTREFQREHPCPSTGKTSGACPGYRKDHIRPLSCGGADAVQNLQWQTVAAARAKPTMPSEFRDQPLLDAPVEEGLYGGQHAETTENDQHVNSSTPNSPRLRSA